MKIKTIMLCMVTFLSIYSNNCNASNIISIFLRAYPSSNNQDNTIKQANKLHQPGKIAYYHIKQFLQNAAIDGIFATYAGYITFSTYNGQILFPNKQTAPIVYLLITRHLTPIIMIASTIHHWEIEERTPTELYHIERKQDEITNVYFWNAEKISLPENKIIPTNTIWLLAQPKKIYVPLGVTRTTKSQNFIIPPIYVKKGIMKIANAIYILNLKQFFKPVTKEFKQEKALIQEQVI